MKQKLITDAVQGKLPYLNNAQAEKLQMIMQCALFNYEVTENENRDSGADQNLVEVFLAAKRIEGCSEKSLKYYQSTIQSMLNDVGKGVKYIITDDIRNYLTRYQEQKQSSRVTIDNIRRILSSFFAWLEDEDYILKSPVIHNISAVTKTMIKYSYPNIKTEDIKSFCTELLNSIDMRYNQKPDEKFVSGALKRAANATELTFIQNNTNYIMQDSFAEFYVSPIMTFPKSMHYFDEELSIQEKVRNIICVFNNGNDKDNYEFINSRDNILIQISDLVAGVLGKMFRFFNTTERREFRGIVSGMTDQQLYKFIKNSH